MIYFICGAKEKEIEYEKIIEEIKERIPNITEKYYDAAQKEEERFMESASTNSLFGGKELLVLKRAENIKKVEKFVSNLLKYDSSKKEIVIDCLDEDGKLGAKIEKSEKLKLIEIKKDEKNTALRKLLRDSLDITDEDAVDILEIAGTDPYKIKNEIEKLKSYFADKRFDIKTAKKIISVSKEYNIFELTEKFLKGEKSNLFDYLDAENAHMQFLYIIAKELTTILKMKILEKEGKLSIKDGLNYNKFKDSVYPSIKDFVPLHQYVLFKKIPLLSTMKFEKLKEKLNKILEIEVKIKSGEYDEKTGIEMFILAF